MTFPIKIKPNEAGRRVDSYLAQRFPEESRAFWLQRLKEGSIMLNGKEVKASYRLQPGDEITFSKLSTSKATNPSVDYKGPPVEICYQDEDFLIIHKPIGLTVHPGKGRPLENTLLGYLMSQKFIQWNEAEWGGLLEEQRPGIVHRLDHDTSGLLVVALNRRAHRHLSEQFAKRQAGRLYWAVIEGHVETLMSKRPRQLDRKLQEQPCCVALKIATDGSGSFASYLARDPRNPLKFSVSSAQGKQAITHFKTLSVSENDLSLIELKLETGRTHQIRVHLSFLGFPILGDTLYGGEVSTRMWLHAHTLEFLHPRTGEKLRFFKSLNETDTKCLKEMGLDIGAYRV